MMKSYRKIKRKGKKFGFKFLSLRIARHGGKRIPSAQFQGFKYIASPYKNCLHLLETLTFELTYKKHGKVRGIVFTIPQGYEWDGASIPNAFRPLVGEKFAPEFALASLAHDYVIDKKLLSDYPESRIFYEILKTRKGKNDIPAWKEKAMYVAVFAWSIIS